MGNLLSCHTEDLRNTEVPYHSNGEVHESSVESPSMYSCHSLPPANDKFGTIDDFDTKSNESQLVQRDVKHKQALHQNTLNIPSKRMGIKASPKMHKKINNCKDCTPVKQRKGWGSTKSSQCNETCESAALFDDNLTPLKHCHPKIKLDNLKMPRSISSSTSSSKSEDEHFYSGSRSAPASFLRSHVKLWKSSSPRTRQTGSLKLADVSAHSKGKRSNSQEGKRIRRGASPMKSFGSQSDSIICDDEHYVMFELNTPRKKGKSAGKKK